MPEEPTKTETWLITGANRGIGLEHALQALAAGTNVIAACRDPQGADALAQLQQTYPSTLRIEQLDVADGASIDALAARIKGVAIDVLINNAGLYGGSWTSDAARQAVTGMDYDLFAQILQVNVIGAFRVTATLLPNLELSPRRLVVMMSSDLGSIANNTMGQSHAYRASKAALNMLTRGLAVDLKDAGVTIFSMAPGWTRTDLGGDAATWSVEDSVSNQRQVIAGASAKDSGHYINLKGEEVRW